MSYSLTIDNVQMYPGFDEAIIQDMLRVNPRYPELMNAGVLTAVKLGMSSAVITVIITPNPYGDDEVIDVSVRGMTRATSFQEAMMRNIAAGPQPAEASPSDAETAKAYFEHLNQDFTDEY